MSGIEPESERFDLQMSTSVVGRIILPIGPQPTRRPTSEPLGPESPSIRALRGIHARHSVFVAPGTISGQRAGWADVALLESQATPPVAYAARGSAA